jgi:hypothetical protein
MKNIIKYTVLLVVSLLVTISCTDDDATRFPEFQQGVSARVFLYPERSFVNFDDLSSASIAFDVYTFSTDLQQIVYKVQYLDADNQDTNYPTLDAITVPASAFVAGKATELEITAAELATLFNLPGGVSHLSGGDSFVFTAEATLTDGRVYNAANSAPSITGGASASFTTTFTAYVGCPSPADQIAGTYEATMIYNNGSFGIGHTVEVEVTFVGPEPFRYNVTDHTAELYVPFGGEQYEADFYDICGTTVLQPAVSFGGVTNFVDPSDPNLLAPVIDLSGPQPTFVLNWFEDNNSVIASVRFVKKP